MLKLLTGQPGNGKTLYALKEVIKPALDAGRPVFLSGVPLTPEGEAALPGCAQLGDLRQHVESYRSEERGTQEYRFTLPPDALVVIDEAQRVFPRRTNAGVIPPHVAAFETHRHQGLDFVLMTQGPKLLDAHLRPLTGWHWHLVRRAGLERTNVYAWEECEDDPMGQGAKAKARHSVWPFPAEVYGWYRSAESHTHKRNLPWKQIAALGVAAVVVIASASYTAWHVTHGAGIVGLEEAPVSDASAVDARPGFVSSANPWDVAYRSPRVAAWDRTAPVYDELQDAKSQPKVAGCMQLRIGSATTCRCYTSQRSVLPLDRHECARLIRDGWFDETRPELNSKEENIRYLNARDSGDGHSQAEAPPSSKGEASSS